MNPSLSPNITYYAQPSPIKAGASSQNQPASLLQKPLTEQQKFGLSVLFLGIFAVAAALLFKKRPTPKVKPSKPPQPKTPHSANTESNASKKASSKSSNDDYFYYWTDGPSHHHHHDHHHGDNFDHGDSGHHDSGFDSGGHHH